MSFNGISFAPISADSRRVGTASNVTFTFTTIGSFLLSASTSVYNTSISLTTIGNITLVFPLTFTDSITVSTIADITTKGGFNYSNSIELDGISDINASGSFSYFKTLSITSITDVTFIPDQNVSLTISAIADVTLIQHLVVKPILTLTTIADLTLVTKLDAAGFLTLTTIGNVTSPGGLVIEANAPIYSVADIHLLPGTGWFSTLEIDCISDFVPTDLLIKNETVSLSSIADITPVFAYIAGPSLSIIGIAAINVSPNFTHNHTLLIGAFSYIYIENLHNFFNIQGFSDTTQSYIRTSGNSEAIGSQGSVSATANAIFRRSVSDTLNLTDRVGKKKPTEIIESFAEIRDSVTVIRIRKGIATDTINFSDLADWSRPITNTLTLTETVSVTKVITRSVSDRITFSDGVSKQSVLNLHVTDTIDFDKPNDRLAPIIASNNELVHYNIPTVNLVVVPKRCMMYLTAPSQSMVLPCPLFGDSQAFSGTLNLKRTMTGDTYTYVRNTSLNKLKYSFNIWTNKYLELRDFILNHSQEQLTLMNHKGETWYVYLMNNPIEFAAQARWQPKGEQYSLTLEFEGVRVK